AKSGFVVSRIAIAGLRGDYPWARLRRAPRAASGLPGCHSGAGRSRNNLRTMSSLMPAGAATLLRHGSFVRFLLSRSLSRFCSQVGAVAIGWQIYDLTGSAFELGMVGLVQFLP